MRVEYDVKEYRNLAERPFRYPASMRQFGTGYWQLVLLLHCIDAVSLVQQGAMRKVVPREVRWKVDLPKRISLDVGVWLTYSVSARDSS
jgi:hypothetical protein